MHKIFTKIISTVGVVASLVLAIAILPACSDEVYSPVTDDSDQWVERNPDGTYGPFDMQIRMCGDGSEDRSRGGVLSTEDFKVKNAWVGMFDVETGYLIASEIVDFSNASSAPSIGENIVMGSDYVVTLHSILLNDNNNVACIAGVANIGDQSGDGAIRVYDSAGNPTTLYQALYDVYTIDDYRRIAVDTHSAEMAQNGENCPVIAGFWSSNSHANFTVDNNGTLCTNVADRTGKFTFFDLNTKKVNKNCLPADSKIHLRRMYSHINVNVTVDNSAFDKFENPTVQLYNMPAYTFVQEHTTVTDASRIKPEEWADSSHCAADRFGTFDMAQPLSVDNPTYFDSQNSGLWMNAGDEFSFVDNGNGTSTIHFGYYHYETKHWGLPSVARLSDRERMHGNSGVYASLCPTADADYNNNAAYMVLSADVSSNGYRGKAQFIIHEGYACLSTGDQATTDAAAARDFSTFRNVNYTYNVEIGGINDMIMKVTADDLDGDYNHGTAGELTSEYTRLSNVAKAGATFNVHLPEGTLYWAVKDENGNLFGVPLTDSSSPYYDAYPKNVTAALQAGNSMLDVTINGTPITEVTTIDEAGTYQVTFPQNKVNTNSLYLCSQYISADGLITYTTVREFKQDGGRIDPPTNLEMPGVPGNSFVIGVDDHMLRWTPTDDAVSYKITLKETNVGGTVCGGYTAIVPADGTPFLDTSTTPNINVQVVYDSQGKATFRMRYANSQKSLMNLVSKANQATATFDVCAINEAGRESEHITITKTAISPFWDFNSTEWQNAVFSVVTGSLPITFQGNQYVTLNGLTLYPVDDQKVNFGQINGGLRYIQTGGSGSRTKRVFRFRSIAKGKLAIVGSNTGSGSAADRYVVVGYGESSSQQAEVGNNPNSKPGTVTISNVDPIIDYSDAENIFIYTSGNANLYSIKFTPEDR